MGQKEKTNDMLIPFKKTKLNLCHIYKYDKFIK